MMKKSFYLLFPLLLTLFPPGTGRTEETSAGAGRTWTEDDIILAESASGWEISPDGSLAVSVRSEVKRVKGEEKRVTNLWLTRLEGEKSIPLTRGTDRVSSPAFSPDGRLVAFLSNRSIPGAEPEEVGKNQVWLIPVGGGEAYPSTRFDRSVEAFGWIDAKSLVVLAPESLSSWERKRKEKKDTTRVVDDADHEPPVRLFRVAIGNNSVDRLTRNRDWIDSLSVSPGGKHAVVTAQQSLSYQFDQKQPPHTFLVDLESGAMTRLFEAGVLLPVSVRWAPDSTGFYLVNEFTRHPVYRMATISELHFYALDKRLSFQVDLDWDRGLGRGDYLPVPGGILVLLADGVRNRPAQYIRGRDGWRKKEMNFTHAANIDNWAVSRDGNRVMGRSRPPQWFAARRNGSRLERERPITKLNPGYAGKP
ncbi:MAG: hypothetical protein O6947_02595, partial [Acidobacteria bacterium]|nr:hypothetical protein [Acidobacteriota bacterium]